MNNIKCSDSEVVLFSSWCLCEMIWQNRCYRNNAFLCLPSQMINVLGSSQHFLPNADSANRRNGSFRCSPVTEGIKSFLDCLPSVSWMLKGALVKGCVLPRPWPWLKAHRLCCSGVCSFFPKPEGAPEDGQRWQSEEHQCHQPPHWNFSPALEVQKGVRMKILHVPESSIAEIQRGQNRRTRRFRVACSMWALCRCVWPSDLLMSPKEPTSHSLTLLFSSCFPSPGYLSFPIPCQFYVPHSHSAHWDFSKPWIWSWVPPTLKSFSGSDCCLNPYPQPPTHVKTMSKLFILAYYLWWPGPAHFFDLVSHQIPLSWPSMHQGSGTGVVPCVPGSLLSWISIPTVLLIPCFISPLLSLVILYGSRKLEWLPWPPHQGGYDDVVSSFLV